MKIRTEKVIDVQEWDKFVSETYGRPYNFQQQDGCRDRGRFCLTVPDDAVDYKTSASKIGAGFSDWLAKDPQKPLDDGSAYFGLLSWWHESFYPNIQMIANDLHEKGLLEAGEYTINIDW